MLGSLYGTDNIPESAAPARVVDATSLPATYIEVGELDLFREEDVEFAGKLWKAGISTELHNRPGCMHAFDMLAEENAVAKRAILDRLVTVTSIEEVRRFAEAK